MTAIASTHEMRTNNGHHLYQPARPCGLQHERVNDYWLEIEERLWAYLGGIARDIRVTPLCIGGVEDHVHLLLGLHATHSVSNVVQRIKGGSSKWMSETFSDLRLFAWQDGYAAFAVGRSQIPRTVAYIQVQRGHHLTRTFKEEYLDFLVNMRSSSMSDTFSIDVSRLSVG